MNDHPNPSTPLSAPDHAVIVAHLEATSPLLCAAFGEIPIMYATYPSGLDAPPTFHAHLEQGPATIPTVEVRTTSGLHRFPTLSMHNVIWLARGRYAVELHSWSPTASNPEQAAFGRVTLEPNGSATFAQVVQAAQALREELRAYALDALVLLDGVRGLTLWIPFDDSPSYDALSAWLHSFVTTAAAKHEQLLSVEPLRINRGNRIYVSIRTNHPGMATVLPYQLRGLTHLPVAIPVDWEALVTAMNGDVTVGNFVAWFEHNGDLFTDLRKKIGLQKLPPALLTSLEVSSDRQVTSYLQALGLTSDHFMQPPNPIMSAVLQILADGAFHSADDIFESGTQQGLFKTTTRKHLYTDLYEYIARTVGTGRKPEIVQDPITKAFRLNLPLDPWPETAFPPLPQFIAPSTVEALIQRLTVTSTGTDPTAFEIAVCDAFTALGFHSVHFGGNGEPDGTLDAPLGVDAYRIILECKTASPSAVVANPRPEEPDSFRTAYSGTYAIVIGPAFSEDTTLNSELLTHRVSLWTVADLCSMLHIQADPHELRSALAPGRAKDACEAIIWERDHGRRKRIAVLAQTILTTGWKLQTTFILNPDQSAIPPLTRDTLSVVIDEVLIEKGLPAANPTELESALAQLLADGLVVPAQSNTASFVITRPPSGSYGRSISGIISLLN